MTSTQCQFKTMRFEVAGEVIGKGRPRLLDKVVPIPLKRR